MLQQPLPFSETILTSFPQTKYMGSKQRLLPFIREHVRTLKFSTVLDAFSGSGTVAYMFKQMGVTVYSNDFLKFCYHIARATIENNTLHLNDEDVYRLLQRNPEAQTFIRDTYIDIFFNEPDCGFLDNLWANIQNLNNSLKRSLALAVASRACMKKRPRGLFTSTGKKGWDNRRDLRLSMREQFILAVEAYNACVFNNQKKNKAFNKDIFAIEPDIADLVYLDPPYVSHYSDSDYTRRYHFVEGYCTYWKGVKIMEETKTKKLPSYDTAFSNKKDITNTFYKLFNHFRKAKIVLSYSSNGIPSRDEIIKLLKETKKSVEVYEEAYRYHHGNQRHKVGNNNSAVKEFLFIAT